MNTKERERFLIDSPTSYSGKKYHYHVGAIGTKKNGRFIFFDLTITIGREILTNDDVDYLRTCLEKLKRMSLGIVGIYPLQE